MHTQQPVSAVSPAPAAAPTKLVDLGHVFPRAAHHPLLSRSLTFLEALLSISTLNRLYTDLSDNTEPAQFFHHCLQRLNVRYSLTAPAQQSMPVHGPLVIVANHPFGGLEGIILGAMLAKLRPDVKCLGNYLLQHIAALREWVIPLDPFGHKTSTQANAWALKAAIHWLRCSGALITFPAGEVSHLRWRDAQVSDSTWSPHVGALIRHTQATVLPVYFHGRNSLWFQSLGLLHPQLRTLLLPHELVNKEARSITVTLGKPLRWSMLEHITDDTVLMTHLRLLTYGLSAARPAPAVAPSRWWPCHLPRRHTQTSIAPPGDAARLQQEVAALPAAQCLVEQGEFAVYLASAEQIPTVLHEIARLREMTFRAIGEGTGKAYDLDAFDRYYGHLFLWHRPAATLAGAYRLGCTDTILQRYGPRGLYTTTLFRFKPQFFARLQYSLELGRAFIRAEYQRQYGCLGMLWRGIATFLVRSPHYQYLFGPVSVSQTYHAMSQQAIVQFLWNHKRDPTFAPYVRPRCPYRQRCPAALDTRTMRAYVQDFQNVASLVDALDEDKGVPVLLHYYLQLGATLLSFNVDKHFAHAIDGLILVDMLRASPTFLRRFMGRSGYAQFMAYHGHSLSA
ncbi:MAG: lysophospholipid acyltransferase family protein [Candidatus Tectimicrobiota bacterium]